MSILFVSSDSSIVDPTSDLRYRFRLYAKNVDKLYCIVFSDFSHPVINESNLYIFPIKKNVLFSFLKAFFILFKLGRVDIVSTQNPAILGLFAFFVSKIKNAYLHVQIHTDIANSEYRKNFRGNIEWIIAKFIIPRADRLRVVSNNVINNIKNLGLKVPSFSVLPIRIDTNKNTEDREEYRERVLVFMKNHEYSVLSLSRIRKEKNISEIIASFKKMRDAGINIGLCIVGDGTELESLIKMVNSYKLNDHILFYGKTKNPFWFYQIMDLLIVNSSYEGYGMTIVEALSCSCPVVSTPVGVAPDYIINGKNGFLFKRGELFDLLEGNILNKENLKNWRNFLKENPIVLPYTSNDHYISLIMNDILMTKKI